MLAHTDDISIAAVHKPLWPDGSQQTMHLQTGTNKNVEDVMKRRVTLTGIVWLPCSALMAACASA